MIFRDCVLYDNKVCDECGECNLCDIIRGKLCDNCGKCFGDYDYKGIEIEDLLFEEDMEEHIHDCDCD